MKTTVSQKGPMVSAAGKSLKTTWTPKKIQDILEHRTPSVLGKFHRYSVLIPLVTCEDEEGSHLEILFEERSADLDEHPGEICFPGGMREAGETAREAAIRETCEELLIEEDCIGELSEVASMYARNYEITAFAAPVKIDRKEGAPAYSRDEVTDVFTVPLSFFLETTPTEVDVEYSIDRSIAFPYEKIGFPNGDYHWNNDKRKICIYNYGDRIIWGITGGILRGFTRILKGEDIEI